MWQVDLEDAVAELCVHLVLLDALRQARASMGEGLLREDRLSSGPAPPLLSMAPLDSQFVLAKARSTPAPAAAAMTASEAAVPKARHRRRRPRHGRDDTAGEGPPARRARTRPQADPPPLPDTPAAL